MHALTQSPAAAYRRVDMDARVEASESADLTRILLEEAVAALGQALIGLERAPDRPPLDALTRANGIAMYLARSVDPANPMRDALVQFYGGLSEVLGRNMRAPRVNEIAQVRIDFSDVLSALT